MISGRMGLTRASPKRAIPRGLSEDIGHPPYLRDAHGDIDLAWRYYRWNLDLAGAIVPLVADVEVTLRNTIYDRLTDLFGRPDWWSSWKPVCACGWRLP